MFFIDEKTVEKYLRMDICIDLMRDALASYSRGEAVQVLRIAMQFEDRKILGVMPAALPSRNIAGAKLLTVYLDNSARHLPSHQGVVVLFETDTGALRAVLDAEGITGIRTAAASAAATDALAGKDAHVLAILGTGLQARRHLEAMRCVRDIREVRVWGRPESAARFAAEMRTVHGLPVLDCSKDVREAVYGADIICTVTASKTPVLPGAAACPGAHINAVGACAPADRELDTEAVRKARLFGDSTESVTREAGDFLIPLAAGDIDRAHLLGEVGAVFDGRIPGRVSDSDVTIFEALGLAVEDLAAAEYIVRQLENERQ